MKFAPPFLLLLCLTAAISSRAFLKRPFRYPTALCARPPVDFVSLPHYAGTWYQLFTNAGAPSPLFCTTARCTVRAGGVDALNCFAGQRGRAEQAQCVRVRFTVRPGAGSVSRLQVTFARGVQPGDYSVAALLASRKRGYYAAAVFSCRVVNGKAQTAWYFLGRAPFRPYSSLRKLRRRLRCKVYPV